MIFKNSSFFPLMFVDELGLASPKVGRLPACVRGRDPAHLRGRGATPHLCGVAARTRTSAGSRRDPARNHTSPCAQGISRANAEI